MDCMEFSLFQNVEEHLHDIPVIRWERVVLNLIDIHTDYVEPGIVIAHGRTARPGE